MSGDFRQARINYFPLKRKLKQQLNDGFNVYGDP